LTLRSYLAGLYHEGQLTRANMHAYQHFAAEFMRDNPYSALFIDCGLGKSVIALTALLDLTLEFVDDDPILIIGPVRVVNETWPTEIADWTHTAGLSYMHIRDDATLLAIDKAGKSALKHGKATRPTLAEKDRMLDADKVQRRLISSQIQSEISLTAANARMELGSRLVKRNFYNSNAAIHLINREQVEWLVEVWGREWPYKTVIIDESSNFKDHTSNRFKALRRVRPLIRRLHELTATPVAETYLDLFAQIFLLDEGKRLGSNITKYRQKYFDFDAYKHTYKLREGAEEQITKLISDICLVMKGEDYLPLEKPVFVTEKIILPQADMDMYMDMERDYIVTLADGTEIEAENAAAKSQKQQQMASGVIYENLVRLDEFGEVKHERIVHHLHDHKIEKLRELSEAAAGEPLLVTYHLKSTLARLQKAFPKATTMDKDGKCVKAWNAGKIPMLFISPVGSGYGLNIQKGGRRMVMFDIPWSFEQFYQTWRRLCRQGQQHIVFIHFLTVVGTIDELIVAALTEKDMTQEKFFRLVKSFQRQMKDAAKHR
jgi:hypothetical protein